MVHWRAVVLALAAAADSGTWLVIAPADLGAAAQAWADYRRDSGWSVREEHLERSDADSQRERVHAHIARHFADHDPSGGRPFAVLLLGDAGEAGIPTWSFPQDDPLLRTAHDRRHLRYASDHPYQLLDEDELPDVALGRVPARTVDEALAVLDKVRRYEQSAPIGPWRRRVSYTAGEGRFGAMDFLLEELFRGLVERLVPDDYDLTMTYAKATSPYCPSPEALTGTILARLGEGALLFNYVGHGWEHGFDSLDVGEQRWPMLERDDLRRLQGTGDRLPIALLTCCSAGWFDLEGGEHSLAEAMLFHEAGPVAVIAGSRPTHPYANAVLQKDVTNLLLVERVGTVGELDRQASCSLLRLDAYDRQIDRMARPLAAAGAWQTSLPDLRRMHVRLYNLLGDPALRIAHPSGTLVDLSAADGRVRGAVPGMASGSASITVECARSTPARAHDLRPVGGPADPDLAAKAAHNYPLANERVLAGFEAPIERGRFDAPLPANLPPEAIVVKVYASGQDDSGKPLEAFGAARLPSPPVQQDEQ